MKHLFYLCSALLFCLGIILYKQTPTYNPFDDVFDIDTNQLTECDTIIGSCGYFNVQPKTDKRLKVFYTVFLGDIDGKGFVYTGDTISIPYNDTIFLDSIMNLPINKKEFNKALSEFGYSYLDKISGEYRDEIRIIHRINFDTLKAHIFWEGLEGDSTKIIRLIQYNKSKPTITWSEESGYIIRSY
ncbi:hypothetical protein ACE193_17145 [Bernardetia sp. OM2101]|uniref:hypothetical protein n=1 Tax=Bernardetia sp. OM2101 TaxID=3344876 RepID=UPI0035D0CA66